MSLGLASLTCLFNLQRAPGNDLIRAMKNKFLRLTAVFMAGLILTGCEFFVAGTAAVKSSEIDREKPFAEADADWLPLIFVGINEKNEIWLEDRVHTLETLKPALQKMQLETPDVTARVEADSDASAGLVGDVQLIFQDLDLPVRISTKKP